MLAWSKLIPVYSMGAIFAILLIAAIIYFWSDTLRAREVALKRCAVICQEMDVQFLDQTVRLTRIRMARNASGHIQFRRFYAYDVSTDGHDRRQGLAILLGRRVESIHIDLPAGPVMVE